MMVDYTLTLPDIKVGALSPFPALESSGVTHRDRQDGPIELPEKISYYSVCWLGRVLPRIPTHRSTECMWLSKSLIRIFWFKMRRK